MKPLKQDSSPMTDEATYLDFLEKKLLVAKTTTALYKTIVNAPFTNKLIPTKLGIGIIVFLLVNQKQKTIDRIALSDTEPARGAVQMSAKKFKDIKIPIYDPENIISKAVRSGTCQTTDDWYYLFTPELQADNARFNQAGAGIASSVVYPLKGRARSGALIFSYFKHLPEIGDRQHAFMRSYSEIVARAIQKVSA